MSKTTINDARVRVLPSPKLIELLSKYKDEISEVPANISQVLKKNGCQLPEECITKVEILQPKIDLKLLASLTQQPSKTGVKQNEKSKTKSSEHSKKTKEDIKSDSSVYMQDLLWLNSFLAHLRKEHGLQLYLHELLENCQVALPENEIIERNPELEARCQQLRRDQQNREYMKMTKNVDSALKNYPEDTIAYQMKTLNKQIIAVFQFVLSVVAGFAFGFLGLEWIIGGLDFGLRLLLGIMIALIIALAEIYFLAKKLNEYDDVTAAAQTYHKLNSPSKTRKPHAD